MVSLNCIVNYKGLPFRGYKVKACTDMVLWCGAISSVTTNRDTGYNPGRVYLVAECFR